MATVTLQDIKARDHCEENIAKVREYHVSGHHQPPYYLDSRIVNMYYQ